MLKPYVVGMTVFGGFPFVPSVVFLSIFSRCVSASRECLLLALIPYSYLYQHLYEWTG